MTHGDPEPTPPNEPAVVLGPPGKPFGRRWDLPREDCAHYHRYLHSPWIDTLHSYGNFNAGGFTVGQNILWSIAQFLKVWALVLAPLFLVSALIEGLVTPLVVRAFYGG